MLWNGVGGIAEVEKNREGIRNETFVIAPNPVGATANIAWRLASNAHVSMTLVSPTGASVGRLFDGDLPAGGGEMQLDVADIPRGLWFLRVTVTDNDGVGHHEMRMVNIGP